MRYAKDESTYILGVFNSGDTVTITIYKISDESIVVNGASCTEIGTTGIFKYLFSQTITQKEEYLWVMNNGVYSKYGKIVLGGWLDDVKSQTDKLQFNTENDVKATLDVEQVTLITETENQIDNIESNVTNPDQYKADVSNLALEATAQAIKTKTDNLPPDPASTTNVNNAKTDIITEIQSNKTLINELLDVEEGNWEIKDNQMIFYKRDGSELMRFNLYDDSGSPSMERVFKREKV